MFLYDDKYKTNIRVIDGVIFSCDEYMPDYDSLAERLAKIYDDKLDDIVSFMLPAIQLFYENESFEVTAELLKESLGEPLINLSSKAITYCNQSLDREHIFSFAYDGSFDDFDYLCIDG